MKLFVSLFLIAHGLVHATYLAPKPDDPKYPFDFMKGWFANFAGDLSKPIGTTLVIVALVCFVLAGLGVMGVPGLESMWKLGTTVGAIVSMVLLTLYWHPWLVLGFVINIVLLYGLYKLHWAWE